MNQVKAMALHREIDKLMTAQGLSAYQVAYRLGVDPSGVYYHLHRKCKCHESAEILRGMGFSLA